MVYMSGELPDENFGSWGFIMRERETNLLLWSEDSSALGVQPKWRPDDALVAVVIPTDDERDDQIYLIDQDGKEVQIIDTNIIGINVVEWSPDGKWLSYGNADALAVYGFAANQLYEFQLPKEIWSIVWSPNGNQLIAGGFLIELSNDCISPFEPKGLLGPYGWLVKEP
jgi:dipeptidyl aminopeptidase/acylaminoacyl peptidase